MEARGFVFCLESGGDGVHGCLLFVLLCVSVRAWKKNPNPSRVGGSEEFRVRVCKWEIKLQSDNQVADIVISN